MQAVRQRRTVSGLRAAFDVAIVASLVAAAASWLRGEPTRSRRSARRAAEVPPTPDLP